MVPPSRASRRVNGHEAETAVVEADLDNDARRSYRGQGMMASTSYEHTAADGDIIMNNGDGEGSDVGRALRRLCTAMARATMVGGVLKGGINTFGLLARVGRRATTGGDVGCHPRHGCVRGVPRRSRACTWGWTKGWDRFGKQRSRDGEPRWPEDLVRPCWPRGHYRRRTQPQR